MLKKVKLNYQKATTQTPATGKIVIPASHFEKLDRAIKEKMKQNERMRIAAYQTMKDLIVNELKN